MTERHANTNDTMEAEIKSEDKNSIPNTFVTQSENSFKNTRNHISSIF